MTDTRHIHDAPNPGAAGRTAEAAAAAVETRVTATVTFTGSVEAVREWLRWLQDFGSSTNGRDDARRESAALRAEVERLEGEAQRMRKMLDRALLVLDCEPANGDKASDAEFRYGHWCNACDDYVDRNMRFRNEIRAFLAVSTHASRAEGTAGTSAPAASPETAQQGADAECCGILPVSSTANVARLCAAMNRAAGVPCTSEAQPGSAFCGRHRKYGEASHG